MKKLALLLSFCVVSTNLLCQDNFKVVTYNILNYPRDVDDPDGDSRTDEFVRIMEAINPDLIVMQEVTDNSGASHLLNELNHSQVLTKVYNKASNLSITPFGGGSGNMLFYNTAIFSPPIQSQITRSNFMVEPDGSIALSPRQATSYRLLISSSSNSNTSIPLYIISVHLKGGDSNASSTEISDEDRRDLGVKDIMDYINNDLSADDNVIVVGDFNFSDRFEKGYATFTTDPNEPLIDPLALLWQAINTSVFTQSTRTTSNNLSDGGAGGGLDDRFDMILLGDEIAANNQGIAYVQNSMRTFGTTGVPFNGSATQGSSPVSHDLFTMSDHYPVVAEFSLDGSDNGGGNDDCTAYEISTDCLQITEDFSGFGAEGFVKMPSSTQLCSNAWDFQGFQDTYVFGGENIENDYTLGATTGGESQGGIYSLNAGALWIQPTSNDFTPGSVEMILTNNTGNPITSLEIAYDIIYLNDQARSSSLAFDYSLDGATYTTVSQHTLTTPASSNGQFTTIQRFLTIENISIPDGANFFMRWTGNDVSGSGSRDEFGLDNISICTPDIQTSNCAIEELIITDNPISNGTYEASHIISTGTIPTVGNVIFSAENSIILGPNFRARANSNFVARIRDCSSSQSTVGHAPLAQIKTEETSSLKLFPNPADGQVRINIKLSEKDHLNMSILNAQGQVVEQVDFGEISVLNEPIDISHYPIGVYIVYFQGAVTRLIQQLVVSR